MKLTILGSTSTIGINTLSVIDQLDKKPKIFALTAKSNYKLLFKQIQKANPDFAVVLDKTDADKLTVMCNKINSKTTILYGKKNYNYVSSHKKCNCVMSAIVGAAALEPTFKAVEAGKKILLANKESLIMSGTLLIKAAKISGAILIPVDSEHNAILQILMSSGLEYNIGAKNFYSKTIKKITLTASGGPFLNYSHNKLSNVRATQAIKHPNWKMGKKISVDSATMMNKGFEVIEACLFFGLKPNQVKVLVHPQSIVHALVSFYDGSTISHMSNHDMRIPISYALSWPGRYKLNIKSLNNNKFNNLTFSEVKKGQFKCLDLAFKALRMGFNAPTILNASNEIAVEKFLENKIKFIDIPVIIKKALKYVPTKKNSSLSSILVSDELTREYTRELIKKI